MPVYLSPDTARALGQGFKKCESRSLLKDKFNLFDSSFNEAKRVSLDLFLPSGRSDIDSLRNDWFSTKQRQEKNQKEDKRVNENELRKASDALAATEPFSNSANHCPQPIRIERRWLHDFKPDFALSFKLKTVSRTLVGLANGTLENAGCSLHPRYGIPYIPGSALKGIALDAAAALEISDDEMHLVFGATTANGDETRKGIVSFLDGMALLVEGQKDLEMDILTPHYQKYYNHTDNPTALDEESPIPNPFPAVCADVVFEFPLAINSTRLDSGQRQEALKLASRCLKHGLINHGIGAKTAAGYGYFGELDSPEFELATDLFPPPPKPILSPEEEVLETWRGKTDNTFLLRKLIKALASLDDPTLVSVFNEIMPKNHLENFRSSNPYWAAFLRDGGKKILNRLNLTLPKR